MNKLKHLLGRNTETWSVFTWAFTWGWSAMLTNSSESFFNFNRHTNLSGGEWWQRNTLGYSSAGGRYFSLERKEEAHEDQRSPTWRTGSRFLGVLHCSFMSILLYSNRIKNERNQQSRGSDLITPQCKGPCGSQLWLYEQISNFWGGLHPDLNLNWGSERKLRDLYRTWKGGEKTSTEWTDKSTVKGNSARESDRLFTLHTMGNCLIQTVL